MPWWGWIIVGTILLGAELLGVDAAFYLLFIGLAALVTGLLGVAGITMAVWVQWLVFAILAVASMVLVRKRLYEKVRGVAGSFKESRSGDILKLAETLQPGDRCRMNHSGSTWTVLNGSQTTLEAGANVHVAQVDGLTLVVEPVNSGAE